MIEAFISFKGKSLTSAQHFYFGLALVTGLLILIPFVIWRFEWLHRFWIFRAMFRWGKTTWGFPASRVGVISGCLLGLVIGGMAIDRNLRFLGPKFWLGAFIIVFSLLPFAAYRDYKLYKRNKKPDDLRKRVDFYIEERTKMRSERHRRK